MNHYILKLKVGKEYYPVNWQTGQVCWEGSGIEPTVFTDETKERAMYDIMYSRDYKFVKILDQTPTRNESETRLSLVKED